MTEPSQQVCPKGEGATHHFVPKRVSSKTQERQLTCIYCFQTEASLREKSQS